MPTPNAFLDNYVEFQGKFFLAKRTSNVRGEIFFVGNVPSGKISPAFSRREHTESTSNNRLVDHTQVTQKKAVLSLTLEDIQKKNLEIALAGKIVTAASSSYSGSTYDTFPSALAVGSLVKLEKQKPTAIIVKDSAATPATLTPDTHYKIHDAKHGIIEILSLGTFTQPFRAQYSYGGVDIITAFEGDDSQEWYGYCALYNTFPNSDQAIALEIFRMQFDPTKVLELINNDNQGTIEIDGIVLRDSTAAADSEKGGYFRKVYLDANQ